MPKFNKGEDELATMFDKWLFVLRNLTNVVRTVERKGWAEGRAEVCAEDRAEIARNLKAMRMGVPGIVKATGLTFEEIEKLVL